MANAILDQFSSTLPAESNITTSDPSSSVSPWGSPKSPPRVTSDPLLGSGTSWDDAIAVSSDDESEYDSDEACEPDKPDGIDLGGR